MSYDDFIDYRFTLLLLTILFQKDNRTQKEKAQSFRSLKSFVCAATTTENAVTH